LAVRLAEVSREELGHVRLCADAGARFGAPRPRFDLAPVRRRIAELPTPVLRLTAILLVEAAIGETISTALFRAGRRRTTEPLSRAVLTRILADEVHHAELGWSAMTALWPKLDEMTRATLQDEGTSELGGLERTIALPALARLQAGQSFPRELGALGVLD